MAITDEQTPHPSADQQTPQAFAAPEAPRPAGDASPASRFAPRAATVSWFGPDRPVLRFLTAAWLVVNMVNVTVWAAVCVTGLHWESPWWLWTFAPPGALLAGFWWLTDGKRS
ncbi:hypothetical protein [Actinomadura gamaensis]|uniref:2TM domain-containing protein n=1 Tax=Actinomadura gamaensis TaxID=1763541 RepID=A0ABV9TRT7_9ACTN